MGTVAPTLWDGCLLNWKDPATWISRISTWVTSRVPGGLDALDREPDPDLCWDDSEWLDILADVLDVHTALLSEALADDIAAAAVKVFHGCRVKDAGIFDRQGLLINDPERLAAEVRAILAEEEDLAWMRPTAEKRLKEFDARDRDKGRLYVCVDDRPQLDYAGHYALYGSEWILCVLGPGAHEVLRRRGVPTIIELKLPLRRTSRATRIEFASKLLQVWTRYRIIGPHVVPPLDFTFMLRRDMPANLVIGHYHPAELRDHFYGGIRRRSAHTTCRHCE